ncbi:MAG: Mini-ribonuclease 3 [Clostridia bacterium]|nr:Mini-ribonuclease 3 [Clostridia bacterium]
MFKLSDKLSAHEATQLSPITLAFIGDAVYTLYVREKLVFQKDEKGGELNKKTSAVVKATAQSEFVLKLLPLLTAEESAIFRRGRNAKKGTKAKSATVAEYNNSTGFEALIGYLYVTGNIERIDYLLSENIQ